MTGNEEPLGLIAAAVTDRTRVIAFSHLQHTDGAVLPAVEICRFARQRNILSVVDGAQACGSLDISLPALGCDFYAVSLHKWINGPHGLGALYVLPAALGRLVPFAPDTNAGWSVLNRFGQASLDLGSGMDDGQRAGWPITLQKVGASVRFLGPRLKALQAVLDFREQLRADRIEARIRELAIYARLRLQAIDGIEILTPPHPGTWGGILAFRPRQGSARELAERLTRSDRISVGSVTHPESLAGGAPAFEAVRASFHIYNSHDDVERLVRSVDRYV